MSDRTMTLIIPENEIDRLPITVDSDIISGAPVFRGTRVPVDALISNLEAGLTLDEFLENFPTVTRDQAVAVLEFYRATLRKLGRAA
jgi:uncharacterized protein (DUF433 family)